MVLNSYIFKHFIKQLGIQTSGYPHAVRHYMLWVICEEIPARGMGEKMWNSCIA